MDNHEIIPFAVHYQNNIKEVKITIYDFVENVKDKIESCNGFPQQFRLQFGHQNCNIFLDLDEPIQLIDRSSNFLNIIADDKADDADKIDKNYRWILKQWHCVSSLCSSVLLHLIFGALFINCSINERSWYAMLANDSG